MVTNTSQSGRSRAFFCWAMRILGRSRPHCAGRRSEGQAERRRCCLSWGSSVAMRRCAPGPVLARDPHTCTAGMLRSTQDVSLSVRAGRLQALALEPGIEKVIGSIPIGGSTKAPLTRQNAEVRGAFFSHRICQVREEVRKDRQCSAGARSGVDRAGVRAGFAPHPRVRARLGP